MGQPTRPTQPPTLSGTGMRGLRAVGDRKLPSPIDKAHGLYNSLYYRTSRDYCFIGRSFTAGTLRRGQTNQFQVPVTGTRLPETGQCVLPSGSRFLPVPASVSPVPAAGKR